MKSVVDVLRQLEIPPSSAAIIVVDHGSRRDESNLMLNAVVAMYKRVAGHELVEPAHMELSEPSIRTAFRRAVERGAKLVVVMPYFLLPGRHWDQDIPRLAAEAAADHPGVQYLVTAPLGLHDAMAQVITQRIEDCLRHAIADGAECVLCAGSGRCQLNGADDE